MEPLLLPIRPLANMSDPNIDGSSLGEGSSSSSSRLPTRAQRHAEEMAREAELEERSRASELARMQTVNFLSKLTKEGHAKEYRKRENDELVERCYFSCTQGFVVMQGELAKRRMLVNQHRRDRWLSINVNLQADIPLVYLLSGAVPYIQTSELHPSDHYFTSNLSTVQIQRWSWLAYRPGEFAKSQIAQQDVIFAWRIKENKQHRSFQIRLRILYSQTKWRSSMKMMTIQDIAFER
jgi:hypothetical protein